MSGKQIGKSHLSFWFWVLELLALILKSWPKAGWEKRMWSSEKDHDFSSILEIKPGFLGGLSSWGLEHFSFVERRNSRKASPVTISLYHFLFSSAIFPFSRKQLINLGCNQTWLSRKFSFHSAIISSLQDKEYWSTSNLTVTNKGFIITLGIS